MSGYQVALLAPTTILAAQHALTFTGRMTNFPVRIGSLSRFQKPAQQRQVLAQLSEGKIDILIGTHRILSKDVCFKNLGLLIIDEEQRFGVKHKEKLKQIRFELDVLSMTATPIPRTLHMSMIGARDLSMIATPPLNRLPVETRVSEYHDDLLKNAVEDELERGGQVFIVHNRISNLYRLHEKLEILAPRARAVVAHGQMDEKQLELIMREFVAGRFDVLIATTIIENGIDIPNVNTIIINRADTLGLSQLYQLRGRVGRSAEQAFAWLLTPSFKSVNEVSLKRLRALEQFTDLGSGFQIAMRDLEIRGAGNILGNRQHGAIAAVGFELYCTLLKEAIDQIQGTVAKHRPEVKVDVDIEAYLSAEYIADSTTRIALYQQLSAAQSAADIDSLQQECLDRFGPLPQEAVNLMGVMKIKLLGGGAGCSRVSISSSGLLALLFVPNSTAQHTLKPFFTKTDYEYEVHSDAPLRLTTSLRSSQREEQIVECCALLAPLQSSTATAAES
jgi:transcription-repair coupling factor (superfamily II helicase)